ncbi:hypothetical protein SANTM175S_02329 [Streptomyces antimycoticus]
MGEGVHPDLMARGPHPADQLRMADHHLAQYEEGPPHPVAAQDVEDLRGPAGVRAVVEGERNHRKRLMQKIRHATYKSNMRCVIVQ